MDLKINVCMFSIALLAAGAVLALKGLWKKLTFREVFTGTLVYVFAKTMLAKILAGIVSAIFSYNTSMIGSALISAGADAVSVFLCFVLVYKVFYKDDANSIVAVSLGAGAALPEMVLTYGYTILSYAIVLNAVRNGSSAEMFAAQGIAEESIAAMTEYFTAISITEIAALALRGLSCILVNVLVSMSIYYAYEHSERKYMLAAFAIILVFDLAGFVIGGISEIAAIVVIILLFIASYVYIVGIRGNYIDSVWSEPDYVKKKSKTARR